MTDYTEAVSAEIKRLEKSGWNDWNAEPNAPKTSPNSKPIEISFPQDFWEPEKVNIESEGVWAQTRAQKILKVLTDNSVYVLWEVGAGNGNVALPLKAAGRAVIGIEPLESGAKALVYNSITVYQGTLRDLAFPDSSILAIGVFDVIEHLEHPEELLEEINRVLTPGGLLITTVPAHEWLFSDFDLSIGHYRRYNQQTLDKLLTENGFLNNRISYFFFSLVLPAYILRRIPYKFGRRRRYSKISKSIKSLSIVMKLIEPILSFMLKIEDKIRLRAGLSLISVSFKSTVT